MKQLQLNSNINIKGMKKDAQLSNEIKKLQYQLSYSQHANKELSDQLKNLCEKTGLPMRKNCSVQNINMINTQTHLQELYYVEPLLMAYQNKIHILEEQLKQLRQDSDALLSFGETIVNENNFLRKQLQNKNQYILKSEQIGLNASFLKLDNQNLIESNNLLKQKNNFLILKLKQTDDQNKRQKMNVSRPNLNLNETLKELREEKERMKNYQLEIMELEKKLEVVTNQLNNQKSILKENQRKSFQLENQVVKLKNQVKIGKQQFQSYQVSHQGIVNNLELQVQTFKNQLMAAQRRQNQLFSKGMALESELQDKNAKSHNLSLQNTQLQTNNNNILQMLQTYEVKVNSQNKRIKHLESEIKDTNESSVGGRKQNEMLEWKLSEKEKEMDRKQAQWKKERDRMSKMWQERFDVMKKTMMEEKESLYDQIQNFSNQKIVKQRK